MNLKHTLTTASIAMVIALTTSLIYNALSTQGGADHKIGLVDSRRLISSFSGTREAIALVGASRQANGDAETPTRENSYDLLSDPDVMNPLFRTINRLVEEFGRRKGYTLILGSTDDGSVLYGNEVVDVTDELISFMNEEYGDH